MPRMNLNLSFKVSCLTDNIACKFKKVGKKIQFFFLNFSYFFENLTLKKWNMILMKRMSLKF